MCKISVIVPVYNTEKFLKQCLESLLTQQFEDYEVILVDDGSTDLSPSICDRYALIYSNVKAFHKENGGAALARKYGIEHAAGEYIAFVDSDDYVEPTFLMEMYNATKKVQAQLVECDYYVFFKESDVVHNVFSEDMNIDSKGDFNDKIVRKVILNGSEAVVVWNKLYKRDHILEFVTKYDNELLEDYTFNIQYYECVDRYVYIQKPLLHYRKVTGSLSRRFNKNVYSCLLTAEKIKREFMQRTGLITEDDQLAADCWFLNYTFNYVKNSYIMNKNLRTTEKKELCGIFKDEYFLSIYKHAAQKNISLKFVANRGFLKCNTYFTCLTMLYNAYVRLNTLRRRLLM